MKFELDFVDKNSADYIVSLYVLGVLSALSENLISIYHAERAIFTPRIASAAEKLCLHPKLIKLLWDGTELEDVESLMPEKLASSILELRATALELVSELDNKSSIEETDLIKSLIFSGMKDKFKIISDF